MEFDFGPESEKDQHEYAAQLSENLLFYPPAHVIGADYLVNRWNQFLLRQLLGYFIPGNMRVDIVSNSFEGKDFKTEPWSGIRYSVDDIKEDLMRQWREISEIDHSQKLPLKNRFIARNFDTCAECDADFLNMTVPKCIAEEDRMKFWFKGDNNFRVPKGSVYVRIHFKEACHDTRNCGLSELFVQFLKAELSEITFEAKVAMIEMLISFADNIFELKIFGFNEKIPDVLSMVFPKISSFEPTEDHFHLMKKAMMKELMNQETCPLKILLSKHKYDWNEKRPHLDDLLFDDFQNFIKKLRSQIYIEGLCYGNFIKTEAANISEIIRKPFIGDPLPVSSRHAEQVVRLPFRKDSDTQLDFYESKENMSVAEVYFQFEQHLELESSNWMALFDLFCDMVKEPFFVI